MKRSARTGARAATAAPPAPAPSAVPASASSGASAGAGAGAGASAGAGAGAGAPPWTFLTNHAHVLLCIAADPEILLRDVAARVGITERAVQRIVSELEADGYLVKHRSGRRNHYAVKADLPLRHPIERHQRVAALLALVQDA